jgi:hypothetical protein
MSVNPRRGEFRVTQVLPRLPRIGLTVPKQSGTNASTDLALFGDVKRLPGAKTLKSPGSAATAVYP